MNQTRSVTPIRFLIVDDNQDLCDILQNYFAMIDDIELCGIAHDGEEALQKIVHLKPDVVFLDIIMPQLDGISVLEKLRENPPLSPPKVIIASAIGQEIVTNQALALGAQYYMIKPIPIPALENRIRLMGNSMQDAEADTESPVEKKRKPPKQHAVLTDEENRLMSLVGQYLMELQMPTHVLGYQYCARAVSILVQENRRCPLAKHVYHQIAKENETSISCVESAIRKAISCTILPGQPQASNGTFLTTIAEKIKLELYQPNN